MEKFLQLHHLKMQSSVELTKSRDYDKSPKGRKYSFYLHIHSACRVLLCDSTRSGSKVLVDGPSRTERTLQNNAHLKAKQNGTCDWLQTGEWTFAHMLSWWKSGVLGLSYKCHVHSPAMHLWPVAIPGGLKSRNVTHCTEVRKTRPKVSTFLTLQ